MVEMIIENDDEALDLLLEKVYLEGGYDFRDYKRRTVSHRLERRLQVAGTRTYLDYMQFLDTHPGEYRLLAEDLTIKTSGFFRSQYAFQQAATLVLPELVNHKREQDKHRLSIWSTACARGEEPYSIAILLNEFLGNHLSDFDILVYATDVSQQALEEAQAGIYSEKDIEGLTPPLLDKYFSYRNEAYRIRNGIRRMLRFSHFDLTSRARLPFSDIDCIFCRNVLIYLQQKLQERVLSTLYNSLSTPGYLILGEAETPSDNLRAKLECLDIKARIYKKSGRE
jgi:chemotaxis methyl-accepting protein methylase